MLYPVELRARKQVVRGVMRMAPWFVATVGIGRNLVGVEGFEPPTPCSQSRCATKLRYTPSGLCDCQTQSGGTLMHPLDLRAGILLGCQMMVNRL
jgi:hypothetical protein